MAPLFVLIKEISEAKADGSDHHSMGLAHASSIEQSWVKQVDVTFKPSAAVGGRCVPFIGAVPKA